MRGMIAGREFHLWTSSARGVECELQSTLLTPALFIIGLLKSECSLWNPVTSALKGQLL